MIVKEKLIAWISKFCTFMLRKKEIGREVECYIYIYIYDQLDIDRKSVTRLVIYLTIFGKQETMISN